MKKILIGLVMAVIALVAFAEPTFDQMQTMIGQKQYSSAVAGLEVIIQNHPQSAKAFYAMAQAQAGLGDLAKAKRALDKARGLDPELKFASSDNIKALEQAITPQVAKIEVIEPSHFWRNLILMLLAVTGISAFFFYRKKDAATNGQVPPRARPDAPVVESPSDQAYMKDYNLFDAPVYGNGTGGAGGNSSGYTTLPLVQPAYTRTPVQQPTVINNYGSSSSSGSSDLLTGVVIGEMLSNNHRSSHTTYVDREVITERSAARDTTPAEPVYEAPSRSSTWDDAPAAALERSSSWDDTPAPTSATKSSSWDDTSSKSSGWDDSSSSSSSSSSSDSSSSSSSSSDW